MTTAYPSAVDTYTTKVNGVDTPDAAHINNLQDAVAAIETALSTNPNAISDAVTATATPASVAAALDMLANRIKAISGESNWYDNPDATIASLTARSGPAGFLINGQIVTSVATGHLTVAIKTLAGTDPSSSDPVMVRIGNTVRTITAALSVTKNAGTNWCGAGASELATKEIDYFVYLGYNATDGVTIGFSRIPWARMYSGFSATSTNENYAAISNIAHAAASDVYEVAGRFNAILSAGAGYTWSIPGTSIIINRPIFETRELDYQPAFSASGSMTWGTITTSTAKYKLGMNTMALTVIAAGTTGGTASNSLIATLPFSAVEAANNPASPANVNDGGNTITGLGVIFDTTPDTIQVRKYDASNYGLGSNRGMRVNCRLEV